MALSLDASTAAAYQAATEATERAALLLAALTGTVSVKVYDGGDNEMGSGTLADPWATVDGATLTVGEVVSFAVTSDGTPDADWYLRITDGTRYIQGTFGFNDEDFRWSLDSWALGQTATIDTIEIVAQGNAVPVWSGDTGLGLLTLGSTVDVSQYAADAEELAFALVSCTLPGVTVSREGTVTLPAAGSSDTHTLVVSATDGIAAAVTRTFTFTVASVSDSIFEPDIAEEVQTEQFRVFDDGISSPNFEDWNGPLFLRWRTIGGNWVDAADIAQGATPFTFTQIPTAGQYYDFNVATLVSRALATGENRGFFLRTSGTSASVTVQGRLNANPPTLRVVTSDGEFDCPVTALARWARSSATTALPRDSRQTALLSASYYGIARFNLNGVTGTVISATMRLYAEARAGTGTTLNVYEADPPRFQVGRKSTDAPVLGLAAQFAGDTFGSDPRVLKAGDFTGATRTSVSGSASTWDVPKLWKFSAYNAVSIVPDPEAPGTSYWRGEFVPVQTGTDPRREALSASYTVMFPDKSQPGYPIDLATYRDNLYYRMYVMLEDDFTSTIEANKMGLSWDLRFGYWIVDATNPNGGYWQNVGGNGGSPGDGTHTYPFTDTRVTNAHIYRGNYQRMEGGVFLADGPYTDLRPWLGYNYQIDTQLYPGFRPYNDIVDMKFRRGKWYCIEQRCRVNSIVGPYDANGNGTAVADGMLETWVNGVKISSQADYKWRRHPSMGIKGINTNWYLGGQATHPIDAPNMHFRISHLALATEYIGPRLKP